MTQEINKIGYLKYHGESVEKGMIDARSAGEALLSLNNSLSHTISIRYPFLSDVDVSTPVIIQKGSWEALIPDTIEAWFKAGAGVVITTYMTTVAKRLADNGFKDKTLTDVLKDGLEAIYWLIKVAKHFGTSSKKKLENLSWNSDNTEVGLRNEKDEVLWIPTWAIRIYELTSESLLIGMIKAIEFDRGLKLGVKVGDVFEEVEVEEREKSYFITEQDENEVLFPELAHGEHVTIEGYVTRGTETSNSIGFRYHDHILTCYPSSGNIKRFKNNLFLRCNIHGTVTRSDKYGGTNNPRPKILFDDLIALDSKPLELSLEENQENQSGDDNSE
tara:strand:- start:1416 stop:2408 length:993 start_codon:yes stop_codon:yes gene_type:complete